MGFFKDLAKSLSSSSGNNDFVTKTIEGTYGEIGKLKVETVREMRAKGYELINEEKQEGYREGFFGNIPMLRYTLTFEKMKETEQKEENCVVSVAAENQTEFDLILKNVGGDKVAVIKIVREITGLSLSAAQATVDSVPSTICILPKATAENAAKKLEAAGATVELK